MLNSLYIVIVQVPVYFRYIRAIAYDFRGFVREAEMRQHGAPQIREGKGAESVVTSVVLFQLEVDGTLTQRLAPISGRIATESTSELCMRKLMKSSCTYQWYADLKIQCAQYSIWQNTDFESMSVNRSGVPSLIGT